MTVKVQEDVEHYIPGHQINQFFHEAERYLFLSEDNRKAYELLLGSMAGNMLPGDPVWLMLVGGPSCGKTELLLSLLDIPGVIPVNDLTGPPALLSGTSEKDRDAKATGGELRRVGKHGCFVLSDFTTVVEMEKNSKSALLNALRVCYDGNYSRQVGAGGGNNISWHGKLGFFSGCTNVIDSTMQSTQQVGERWVYCRMKESPGLEYAKTKLALENKTPRWRYKLRESVWKLFDTASIGFARPPSENHPLYNRHYNNPDVKFTVPQLTSAEVYRVIQMAQIGVMCRASVVRDYRTKEINQPPDRDSCTRFAKVLKQIYLGLARMGVTNKRSWNLLSKLTLDCIPRVRRAVLEFIVLEDAGKGVGGVLGEEGWVDVERLLPFFYPLSRTLIQHTMEDLEVFGLLERTSMGVGGRIVYRVRRRDGDTIDILKRMVLG